MYAKKSNVLNIPIRVPKKWPIQILRTTIVTYGGQRVVKESVLWLN